MIICKPIIGLGPELGETQTAANRLCLPVIGIGPEKGDVTEIGIITYGTSGAITYGTSGKITY